VTVVLCVEDSEVQGIITQRALEREGYQVLLLLDSLNIFTALAEIQPDFIITDIDMPRLDGVEMIRRIRQHPDYESLPILVFTALAGERIEREIYEAGANRILFKPISIPEFRELINEFWEEVRSH
jgi:CheY-like chemotaxis protein